MAALYVIGTIILAILITFIVYKIEMAGRIKKLNSGSTEVKSSFGYIEYSIKGDGIPVIISHGGAGGYDQGFITADLHLDGRFKVISVSRFGHLRSAMPENASAVTQASAYMELMDILGIEKAAVIGTSGGGPSAIQFALKYPDRCAALVLSCAVSQYLPQQSLEGYKHPFTFWIVTKFFRKAAMKFVGVTSEQYETLTGGEKAKIAETFMSMNPISLKRDGLYNEVPEWADKEMWERNYPLGAISVPALIIHAKDDSLIPFKHALDASMRIPDATLMALPDGGHLKLKHGKAIKRKTSDFIYDIMGPNED